MFWLEKGAACFHSHAFLTTFSLFIIVALLSIVVVQRREGQVPAVAAGKLRRARMIVHIELAAVVVILLCAALMAKG